MINWLKFFGSSFFSDKIAATAVRLGFTSVFISLLLAFLFFFGGFICSDTVPFSTHYAAAESYREFMYNAFSGENGVNLVVKDRAMLAGLNGNDAQAIKVVNTYTDEGDKELYVKNGYNLIVDTRQATTLICVDQYAVKKDGDEEISYDEYLALVSSAKENYDLKTRYSDEELEVTAELIEKCEAYFNETSDENHARYNAEAVASYNSLKENKSENYGEELYYLYVKYYYTDMKSAMANAKAPVLRDYYYNNFITGKSHYFYVFGDMCGGSFETDGGLPVVFGGYFLKSADGAVVTDAAEAKSQIDGFIKGIYYATAQYTATSYFVSAISQLPMLIFIPIILGLIAWAASRIVKNGWDKSFSGNYKTVNAFVWFSALVTGLLTFVLGFVASAQKLYVLMPWIFALILLVRTAAFCIDMTIRKRKELKAASLEQETQET